MGESSHRGLLKMAKTDLDVFVDTLTKSSYVVLAPIEEGEATKFGVVGEEKTKIPRLTTRPLKELFFPEDESLLSFDSSGTQVASIDMSGVLAGDGISPRVALGVRPCDARALVILDNVFASEDYRDPYYTLRREQTTIITFTCPLPGVACFCTSTGGGPYDETGSDVMFMEVADSYLVKAVSEKGMGLLQEVFPLSEEGPPEHLCILHEADDEDIRTAMGTRAAGELPVDAGVPVEAAMAILGQVDAFGDSAWEEVYKKCLGCGVCTYLCPTCHCFDIGDEVTGASGQRVRNWDSCMFPLFTLHASGHNPRPSRKERFRQRVMHKFNYFVENNDCIACVGCGRCVENCPVNLDIRQVLTTFARQELT